LSEPDFTPRTALTDRKLIELFNWTENDFLKNTEGSAIRRIGYQSWLRNITVALGNAETSNDVIAALQKKLPDASIMIKEHIEWALQQHQLKHS